MEIRASCIYDLKTIKTFAQSNINGIFKKISPRKLIAVNFIGYGVLTAIILFAMILDGIQTVRVVLLGCVLLMFAIQLWLYVAVPRITCNSLCKMKNIHNHYVFGDVNFYVYSKSETFSGECFVQYSMIVKVKETSAYLYIFPNKQQVYIIDKSTIKEWEMTELRNRLYSYVKDKYVICNY